MSSEDSKRNEFNNAEMINLIKEKGISLDITIEDPREDWKQRRNDTDL